MLKEWRIKGNNLGEKSLIKQLLASRGITSDKEVYEFLHPLEITPSDPDVFSDMQKTVERLSSAIDNGEKIIIYGDFDADGVTSTSLLYRTFKFLGADINYFIPTREKEGHGFDTQALVKIMTTIKPKVIISVDCGISDVDAVNFINSFKIDVIITDHHEAPEDLPNAYAIINPKAPNALNENLSAKEIESLTSLAGVGVALKVAQGLLRHYKKTEFIYEILPFAAVGTISDIVPLIGENRYIVTKGLELLKNHYGLSKLLVSAGYSETKNITSEKIAFGITPRINASGRLGTVEDALKIFISDNKQEIDMAVVSLNQFNKIRQELCRNMFLEAEEMIKNNNDPAIILFKPDWHIGIIGIVASKIVEKYYKPTFLMSYSNETKMYRCSARGIDGISLYDVISENAELFDGFGGHKLAAGLYFSEEKASFEQVKSALNKTVKEMLNGRELKPFVDIDLLVQPEDINIGLVKEIAQLEPFGASNPSPVFAMKNLKLKEKKLMGDNNEHLKFKVQSGNCEFTCIRWQKGDMALVEGDGLDLAFYPQINEFGGAKNLQLIVNDIHSEHLKEEKPQKGLKLYDHRKKTGILSLVNDYVKKSNQNIGIFAESKAVRDFLAPFKDLSQRIFSRDKIQPYDTLMFFDYPADRETYETILQECNPSAVHFMNYDIKHYDDREFLTTFIKMLRYAFNNNKGQVDIIRCASALGKSFETVLTMLDLFEEVGFIGVEERNENYYKINLHEISDLSKVLHSEKYSELKNLIAECEEFQKELLEKDLTELV